MDLLFLGTSSGTPTKTRNVTGLALIEEQGRQWFLIDCGEGTQHQLLRTGLSVNDLETVFITHVHGDHCYGLPGLLASAGMHGRRTPLTVIAPLGVEAWWQATVQHTQLHLPYEVEFKATESLTGHRVRNVMVDAITLSHRVPSYAYAFTEAEVEPVLDVDRLTREGVPQGPLWGQLKKGLDIDHEGRRLKSSEYLKPASRPRKVVVGGDNDRPALLAEACRHADVLVHEATYTADVAKKVGEGVGHSSADIVAAFAQEIALPNLVLTHFSARYQSNPAQSPSIADVQGEAAAHYRGKLFMAEDFARYRLHKTGAFERTTA